MTSEREQIESDTARRTPARTVSLGMASENCLDVQVDAWEYTTLGEICARGKGGVQTGHSAVNYMPQIM